MLTDWKIYWKVLACLFCHFTWQPEWISSLFLKIRIFSFTQYPFSRDVENSTCMHPHTEREGDRDRDRDKQRETERDRQRQERESWGTSRWGPKINIGTIIWIWFYQSNNNFLFFFSQLNFVVCNNQLLP